MKGDIRVINGVEYEIVWDGGEGLIPDRETKPGTLWTPPKRVYKKSGRYSENPNYWIGKKHVRGGNPVDNRIEVRQDLSENVEDELILLERNGGSDG